MHCVAFSFCGNSFRHERRIESTATKSHTHQLLRNTLFSFIVLDLFTVLWERKEVTISRRRYHPMRNYRFVVSPAAQFLCLCVCVCDFMHFSLGAKLTFIWSFLYLSRYAWELEYIHNEPSQSSCTQIYWITKFQHSASFSFCFHTFQPPISPKISSKFVYFIPPTKISGDKIH